MQAVGFEALAQLYHPGALLSGAHSPGSSSVRYYSHSPPIGGVGRQVSPKPYNQCSLSNASSLSSPSSSRSDGSISPTNRLIHVSNMSIDDKNSNSDEEILDLTLPARKRASNDNSQPSYKKSLIKRYCKS